MAGTGSEPLLNYLGIVYVFPIANCFPNISDFCFTGCKKSGILKTCKMRL